VPFRFLNNSVSLNTRLYIAKEMKPDQIAQVPKMALEVEAATPNLMGE